MLHEVTVLNWWSIHKANISSPFPLFAEWVCICRKSYFSNLNIWIHQDLWLWFCFYFLHSFSSTNDKEDDDLAEFRKCIRVLADKIGSLLRHREELLDKYSRNEATNEQLQKELEEKKDQVKTYYNKHQLEKQVDFRPCLLDVSFLSLLHFNSKWQYAFNWGSVEFCRFYLKIGILVVLISP